MIAIDTNILIYAHLPKFSQHAAALNALEGLANSGNSWAVPWPCAHEFCAVVTNRKWRSDALDGNAAMAILRSWSTAPNFQFLGASSRHLSNLALTLKTSGATGGQIHDARIVATCLDHGVTELWTADRDFSRFPLLRTRNPLI